MILYHVMVPSEDGKAVYIIPKQPASQLHNNKIHNKTDVREKPKLREYLIMMQLLVELTTVELHGHPLGLIA